MLELFHALAVRLHWLRPVAALVTLVCLGLFVYAASQPDAPQSYFTSALAGACWGLLLFMFVSLYQKLPDVPAPNHSWWQRTSLRLQRAAYALLATATIGIFLAVIVVTFKAR